MIEIWNSLFYAKSPKMWWDTCCKNFIQFGWETKKLEFSSGLFLILAKTLQGQGSSSFWPNDLKPSSSWSWICPLSPPRSREKSIWLTRPNKHTLILQSFYFAVWSNPASDGLWCCPVSGGKFIGRHPRKCRSQRATWHPQAHTQHYLLPGKLGCGKEVSHF